MQLLASIVLFCTLFFVSTHVSAQDKALKLKMYKAMCLEAEQAMGCARAGVLLDQQKKYKQAFQFYKRACFHANGPVGMACFLQGLLIRGKPTALPLFVRACKLKDPDGCEAAGEHLFLHKKTRQHAAPYLKKGCVGGVLRSCHFWGRWFQWKKQPGKAHKLWTLACNSKYGPACGELGRWYAKRKKQAKAAQMYQRGCALKHAVSCAYMGLLLLKKRQKAKAKPWLQRACRLRLKAACKKLKGL